MSVWNRTPGRAQALARELGARAVRAPEPADVLVNCTSVGLRTSPGTSDVAAEEQLSALSLSSELLGGYELVVDLVYGSEPTALLAAARAQGARTVDGLEVLVCQGALSLQLWTGRSAPLEVMRAAAREA